MKFEAVELLILLITLACLGERKGADAKPLIGPYVEFVTDQEFLSVASILRIQTSYEPEDIDYTCMGTVVSNRDILTTGHCLEDETVNGILIKVGSTCLTEGITYYPLWWKTYSEWLYDVKRRTEMNYNDVAVIRLRGTLPVQIIPAQISTYSNLDLYGMSATAVGWGSTLDGELMMDLQKVNMEILPNEICERMAFPILQIRVPLPPRILCSISHPFAFFSPGDSGGALFHENQIVAINSGVYPRLPEDDYTNKVNLHFGIDYYREFILDVIRNF